MAKSRTRSVQREELDETEHELEAPAVEDESQDHDREPAGSGGGDGIDKGNKASLVRAALAAGHTKPREGVRWIRETYGVEVEGTYFSVAKSQQAKRSGDAPAPRSIAPPIPRHNSPTGSSAPGVPAGFGGDVRAIRVLLANHDNEADAVKDLIASVDTLVRKYGVSGLNEMIDAFAE